MPLDVLAQDLGGARVGTGSSSGLGEAIARLLAAAAGEIDVLVNNAGVYGHAGWQDATPDVWRDIYETNVLSAVRMIQRFVPGMRARGWGRVVQIGRGLGSQPIAIQPTTAPPWPPGTASPSRWRESSRRPA